MRLLEGKNSCVRGRATAHLVHCLCSIAVTVIGVPLQEEIFGGGLSVIEVAVAIFESFVMRSGNFEQVEI